MNMLEQRNFINNLFDIYGALLSSHQQNIFVMYYHDDLSYQEIASQLSISRAAVHDTIRRSVVQLEHYESVIGMCDYRRKVEELLTKVRQVNNKDVNILVASFNQKEGA